jgi:phospholipid-binding lipoprotein MlaA
MALDHVVVGPITHAYMGVTPRYVQRRVSAAVFNLGEPSTVLEDVLQGRPRRAGRATARFLVNSTVGVLGLFDVASGWGLKPHTSDFGQTLGRYGAQPGPYIYGVIAPFNLRDGIGRVVDVVTDPVGWVIGPITSTPGAVRTGAQVIDTRVDADPAFRALKDAQDPYVTVRSAYAQYRAAIVNEGTPSAAANLPDFEPAP